MSELPTRGWTEARVAAWVRDTCLMCGTTQKTAHAITVMFLQALENDGIELNAPEPIVCPHCDRMV
jgi:hypothetical protein